MTTIALLAWPIVTLALALRLPFPSAVAISILGGFLLLPVEGGMNLPVLPTFNKDTIPSLTLLVLAILFFGGRRQAPGSPDQTPSWDRPGWLPHNVFAMTGLLMIVLGSLLTALTNGDRLVYDWRVLPGLRLYDGLAFALTGLTMLVPLLLGRKFFAHPDRHALLLKILVAGGMAYSFLVLYEVRMSPQFSTMVYGFFPHDWRQHFRGGGWRPVVFMEHGLQLTLFVATVALAAFGAWRSLTTGRRSLYLLAGVWLLATLILSNSLGATVIALFFLPFLLMASYRMQVLCAATIAAIVVLYPMLRSADIIPTERMVSIVHSFDHARAASLEFRFDNEDRLLEHANEKPIFGWGGWNRNRVFNDDGSRASTTDGAWIIVMGIWGWVGYLGQFGLLAMPIILLALNRRRYEVSAVTSVLALVLSASLVNLIPNGFLSPVTLLMAGALWGRLELGARVLDESPKQTSEAARGLTYARDHAPRRDGGRPDAARGDPSAQGFSYTRQTKPKKRLQHQQ